MPTIKDIAREAGVSHGTVSNVINGRGNVSVEKIQLVWQAAERLGYKVNTKAQSLRQGKDKAIAILLPTIEQEHFAAMYEVYQSEFAQHGYRVQLYTTRSQEQTERAMLREALNARVSAVISSSCLENAAAQYRADAADIPLVFLQSSGAAGDELMYAGFQQERAGREIAQYLMQHKAERIGVFSEPARLPEAASFLRGLQSVYVSDGNEVRMIDCPNSQIELRAFEFFDQGEEYDYLICTDRKRADALRAAFGYAGTGRMPQIITISLCAALTEPDSAIYELDYKRLAHQVVKKLLERLEKETPMPGRLQVENNGFRNWIQPAFREEKTLRFLTVASPATAALRHLLPYLKKRTGICLEMTVLPLQQVYEVLQTEQRHRYDLIRMDVAWLDEMADRVYRPLNELPFDWNGMLERVIPELRKGYSMVRGVSYCLPYDPSTQLLFYRKDLFEDPIYKRMYYEQFREKLSVPTTFDAFNRVAAFFTRAVNPESPVQYGSTAAIGNAVVTPSEFLPRLFAEGSYMLDSLGRIRLNTPEALRALRSYRETYAYSDRTVHEWWNNVLENFAEGSAAMTLVFINHASDILNLKLSNIEGKLGFTSVPGKMPILGGGVIGISQDCLMQEEAYSFLNWLYADSVAPMLTMLGGLSPCLSAYQNRDVNEKYPWLSAARRNFPYAKRRSNSTYYRNFSELQLENIMAAHIQRAVFAVCSPEEALREMQAECDAYFKPW